VHYCATPGVCDILHTKHISKESNVAVTFSKNNIREFMLLFSIQKAGVSPPPAITMSV